MKGYSETQIFTPREVRVRHAADFLLRQVDQETYAGELIRCHEVARAIGKALGLSSCVYDGKYGHVEHSWLQWSLLPNDSGRSRVRSVSVALDTYAVGRLPLVQLVSFDLFLPHHQKVYRAGKARTDIRESVIDYLLEQFKPRNEIALDYILNDGPLCPHLPH